jgi:ABC-2 type transport system permease protein
MSVGGQGSPWLAVWTLAARELVRFFRQRTRVVGALGQPVIFWILFGAGLSGSFRPPAWASADLSYQAYFFPGVTVLILMFTAIFSTISIIEDRREGFLQGVLVAPIPRWSLVLGKLAGGTVLAALQAGLFLLLGWVASRAGLVQPLDLDFSPFGVLATGAFVLLVAFALTALGFVIAWPMDSTQGFHAIMSVFLLPMWLVSGAFFPAAESGWMAWVIALNPLSYGVAGLRRVMTGQASAPAAAGLPALWVCVLVTILFCIVCVSLAVYLANRQTSRDLR